MMVLSERSPEDKQSLKSGIMAIAVLVACGMFGPTLMAEVTGINTETLCVDTSTAENANAEECLDDEGYKGDLKKSLKEMLNFWIPLAVFLIGSIVFAILGIKF